MQVDLHQLELPVRLGMERALTDDELMRFCAANEVIRVTMLVASGAVVAWLIDPERKVVEIYRPGTSPEVVEGTSAVYGDGPVSGHMLELARVWG